MPLNKAPLSINFASGLDTKTDPFQVAPGRFLSLENTVFNKGGLLQKRNGYGELSTATFAGDTPTYLTTLNGNLTVLGDTISAYSQSTQTWVNNRSIQPMQVSTLPLIKNSINQTQCDAAVAPNGLVCTVYTETNAGTTSYKYAIANVITGQNIIPPKLIPAAGGTVTGSPRVFVLGNYFIIVFTNVITATSHLQYIAVNLSVPTRVTANVDIASAYTPANTVAWDGVVSGNRLYVGYNTTAGGQSVKVTFLTATLVLVTPIVFAGSIATMMSLCVDSTISTAPIIYVSFYDSASTNGFCAVIDSNMNVITAPTQFITAVTVLNIASAAQNKSVLLLSEVSNNYSYDSAIPTHFINKRTMSQAGALSGVVVSARSVGLASKAFIVNGTAYYLAAYQSSFQPTYFLINGTSSSSTNPLVVGKLAYQNGGGYLTLGLPSVTVSNGNVAQVAYLIKDLIEAVNKNTNVPSGSQVNGIFSQTGINLGTFIIGTQGIDTAEIAGDLHTSGGFLGMYDGFVPVEHNFFLYPDNVEVTTSGAGGLITAQQYFYQVTYEWSDNQGNNYKSAPSIPVSITTTGATSSNTINVPMLRLTYKVFNKVKIVIYRWSTAQQIYYQVTSLTSATLNNTTIDSVAFVDTLSDSTILGNNILYTTGGVLEDVNAPATNLLTLFDTRLWLVDAEDPNLLWFSKQVIEAVPVEMSDLLTMYIAPTTGAQGSTGPMTAISVLDDKLIIFKRNAIYYVNGSGPDNTGANSQYSQPIFITATVGCANQQSIVFMPNGLMFESDKGIWLLGRDLSTSYIGAPVEKFTEAGSVQSAVNVPATNQVRFTLDSGITLMYDYYYQQWGSFKGVPAISSTLYQGLHTYLNDSARIFQETPDLYLDGTNPVLISFQTGWMNLAGLQGFQRAYFFYLLGSYITPHKLTINIAYDYASTPSQTTSISPDNFNGTYGSDPIYGDGSPYGGNSPLEQWRIFFQQQKCESFQISLQESYDSTKGVPAGAGLTISGLNMIVGLKKGYTTLKAARSVG